MQNTKDRVYEKEMEWAEEKKGAGWMGVGDCGGAVECWSKLS